MAKHRVPRELFIRGSFPEVTRIAAILRRETVGGALLLKAAVVAIVWANSPVGGRLRYLQDTTIGHSALHLDLTLSQSQRRRPFATASASALAVASPVIQAQLVGRMDQSQPLSRACRAAAIRLSAPSLWVASER